MPRVSALLGRDILRLLRAINEIGDLPADRGTRIQHLLAHLLGQIGGKLGSVGYGAGFARSQRPRYTFAMGGGWMEPAEVQVYRHYLQGDHAVDPCVPPIARFRANAFVKTRSQLVPDRDWYGCEHVNEARKTAGVDEVMYSIRRLDGSAIWMLAIHRPWGERRPFTSRERLLLSIAHEAIGTKLDVPQELTPAQTLSATLPPRLAETLTHLLTGLPEKHIASTMGLSRHTVHGYIKQIYQHFDVSSRAELAARWVCPVSPP